MRRILFGVITAIVITLGTHGAAFAATPDMRIAVVRDHSAYVDQAIVDDDSLSNQPINDPSD